MTVTVEFARKAGRAMGTDRGLDGYEPEVCWVAVAIPKSRGSNPLRVIDEAVTSHGWKRDGEATWVNVDGFKIRVRSELEPEDPGMPMADHEVWLYGTAAN